jgi:hypothetical protein
MWRGVYRIHQEGHRLARPRRTSSRHPLGWSSITRSTTRESGLLRTGSTTTVGYRLRDRHWLHEPYRSGGGLRGLAHQDAAVRGSGQHRMVDGRADCPAVHHVAHNQLRFGDAVTARELAPALWSGNGEHGRQWRGENHGIAGPGGNDRPIAPRPPVAGPTTWIGASCPLRRGRSHLARRRWWSHRAWRRRREPGPAVP